jgi:hypothetical protein
MIYYLFNARRRRQISLSLHFGRIMASDKNRSDDLTWGRLMHAM